MANRTKYKFSEDEKAFLNGQGFDDAAISTATVTTYGCKDFLSGKGIGPFWGTYGEILAINSDGVLNIYVMPDAEVAKIQKQRHRQYAAFKDEILQVLKDWYIVKCAKSTLSKKQVDQSILRKFKYENLHKATLCIYGEKPVVFSKASQAKYGSLKKWYDRILVDGTDGYMMIAGRYIGKSIFSLRGKDIFFACAVHAIFDFKVSLGYNPNARTRWR